MNKYTIHTQQNAAIVREFEIEAGSESEAQEIIQIMISNGELPDPKYMATETCGGVEIFEVYKQ
jgi:hypothetical protein